MSGGEQQQLAMARGLMTDPDLLLVDEPSAGLSPQAMENVFEHVRRINDEGTAVLMIEQRVREGLQVADRGYVLDRGETRFEGPSEELHEAEMIRDLYLRR